MPIYERPFWITSNIRISGHPTGPISLDTLKKTFDVN